MFAAPFGIIGAAVIMAGILLAYLSAERFVTTVLEAWPIAMAACVIFDVGPAEQSP